MHADRRFPYLIERPKVRADGSRDLVFEDNNGDVTNCYRWIERPGRLRSSLGKHDIWYDFRGQAFTIGEMQGGVPLSWTGIQLAAIASAWSSRRAVRIDRHLYSTPR